MYGERRRQFIYDRTKLALPLVDLWRIEQIYLDQIVQYGRQHQAKIPFTAHGSKIRSEMASMHDFADFFTIRLVILLLGSGHFHCAVKAGWPAEGFELIKIATVSTYHGLLRFLAMGPTGIISVTDLNIFQSCP